MILLVAIILFVVCGITIQSSNMDQILKGILTLLLLYPVGTGMIIVWHKRVVRLLARDDYSAKYYLRKYNKSIIKYFSLITSSIINITIIWGFYNWFNKVYSNMFWAISHTIIVAVLLLFNLYIDTYEGKWYRKLNINIIKDDFVQRKLITMLFLAIFVSVNVLITFI